MTIRTDGGLHIAFHEAALVDYSGMNLQHEGDGRFRAALTPSSDGAKVQPDRALPDALADDPDRRQRRRPASPTI